MVNLGSLTKYTLFDHNCPNGTISINIMFLTESIIIFFSTLEADPQSKYIIWP